MKISIEPNGDLKISLYDILDELTQNMSSEEIDVLIGHFGWQDTIRKHVSEQLMNEYVRHGWNEHVHHTREEFLIRVKEEEVKYYASVIASKLEEMKRRNSDFWSLWNWLHQNHPEIYPPMDTLEIDFDYKKSMEEIIKNSLNDKIFNKEGK